MCGYGSGSRRGGHPGIVTGQLRPPREGEQALALTPAETINGQVPTRIAQRLFFEDRTPLRPNRSESLLA
jgi:transcription termination factor Rho